MKLPVSLSGITARYAGHGRQLGYPTANISTRSDLADGIYFGYADLGEYRHHPALIFLGMPTTVGDTDRRLEAHLLDIKDQDYYDQQLQVTLHHYHRPNQTFASIKDLEAAMQADETAACEWFKLSVQ